MPYEIHLTKRARRRLDELPESVRIAILETIAGPLAEIPHRFGHALQSPLGGQYSARRGEYRIIYRIEEDSRRVFVMTVGHRRDIYRNP